MNRQPWDLKQDIIQAHTHSILMAIFPGEPGLAGCPLDSASLFSPRPHVILGQA